MDLFKTIISEFLIDLRAQKLRAFLTMFGIIWGTVAIIVLVAFGVGFKRQLSKNMHGIGESISIMFPGSTTKPWQGFGMYRPISLSEEDVRLITSQVPELRAISPEYGKRGVPARVGINIVNPYVTGCIPIYAEMRNIITESGGRFLNERDIAERRRVAVIGDEVKTQLFGQSEAVGKMFYVGETPFTVIGVMEKKIQNSSYNTRDKDRIFIPTSTFASVFGAVHLNNIIFQPTDPTQSEEVGDKVRATLAKRYRFDPTDKDAVGIWDTAKFDKFIFYLFLGFNLFMGMIGSFTLGVAGVGVANIMFIVVQERIKEIGIKRAVGAKRSNILAQFFAETFFIVGLSSGIGFLIAYGLIEAMQHIPIKDFVGTPVMSLEVVIATITVLSLIGVSAGIMPARKAANLDVVECLRT